MPSMQSRLLIIGLATTSLCILTSPSESDAHTCRPKSILEVVQTVVPQDGNTASPVTTPIVAKWITQEVLEDGYREQRLLELKVTQQADAQQISGSTRTQERQTLVFEPDEPLTHSTTYDVEAVSDDGEVLRAWSFTTQAPDSLPSPETFEGITNLQVSQVAQPTYTYCLHEDEEDGCLPKSGHTGWSYPAQITLELQGVEDAAFGPGYYAYKIYQHVDANTPESSDVVYDTNVFESQSKTITLSSDALSNAEFCYSVVAESLGAPETPILSPQGIVCVPFEQGDFTPEPDPDTSEFSCAEPEPSDVPSNPYDNPTNRGETPETPPDPEDTIDDSSESCGGCASTPAQGGSMALLWMIPALIIGLRRRRRT